MNDAMFEAFRLYKKRDKSYGSAWREGRPTGITDNLLWIARRLKIQERELTRLACEDQQPGTLQEHTEIRHRIKIGRKKLADDILDSIVFGAFRYIMHEEGKELI